MQNLSDKLSSKELNTKNFLYKKYLSKVSPQWLEPHAIVRKKKGQNS